MSFFSGKFVFRASQKNFQRSYEDVQGIYKVPLAQLYTAAKKLRPYDSQIKKYSRKTKIWSQKKILSCIPLQYFSILVNFLPRRAARRVHSYQFHNFLQHILPSSLLCEYFHTNFIGFLPRRAAWQAFFYRFHDFSQEFSCPARQFSEYFHTDFMTLKNILRYISLS